MRIDLWRLEKKERIGILNSITHFNIHYNDYEKYKNLYKQVEDNVGVGYKKEVMCLVTNAVRAIHYKAIGLSVPRDFAPYKGNKQQISHKRMIRLVDKLEVMGYVDVYIGGVIEWNNASGEKLVVGSAVVFKDNFLALFQGVAVDVSEVNDVRCVIEIKDRESGCVKNNSGHKGVKQIIEYMTAYNSVLRTTEITYLGQSKPVQQYKRVFTNKIGLGGRHYNTVGGVQVMSQEERAKLEINGERVVELDFKAMHASLLYEMKYQEDNEVVLSWIEEEWGGEYNPYDAKMPFLQVDDKKVNEFRAKYKPKHDPIRNLAKHAVMVCLNAVNYKKAYTQVTAEVANDMKLWGTENEAESKFYGLMVGKSFPGHTVCQAVVAHNKPIGECFFKDQGIRMQYYDSEIVAEVINRLILENEALLPEHDSVIVRAGIKDRVKQYMHEAYKTLMGSDVFCYIEEK